LQTDELHKILGLGPKSRTTERRKKIKKIIPFTILLMALVACAVPRAQVPESAATDMPQASMPNPASVYCTQQGNQLEIRTAADGSQYGICVFPDGSTCDEWAYFRGECGLAAQKSPTPAIVVEATSTAAAATRKKMRQAVTCRQVLQKK
jgi:putative hemolysin